MDEAAEWLLPTPTSYGARCIGVVGGRGGAGASTLAAALAVTAARSTPTCLVDLDPLGGGLDLLMGIEDQPGLRWPALASASGQLSAAALAGALPVSRGVAVLSWDRGEPVAVGADAVESVVDAATRAFDVVVLDLARRIDDELAPAVRRCELVLVVVPAEVRAVAAAARVTAVLSAHSTPIQVVVRGPAPSRLTGPVVAGLVGVPLAGRLRPEQGLDRALERGEPPGTSGRGPLAAFAADLLARVRHRTQQAA